VRGFWFPAVGLLLGGLLGCWAWAVGQFAAPMVGAFLVLTAWVLLTGALHIDGFCDLCDGLFGGKTPEDRLRIMKEPTRGTFAIVGCVLLLLGKFVALTELLPTAPWALAMPVLVARCLVLTVAVGARYPRDKGTGKVIIEATGILEVLLSSIVAVGAICSFLCTVPGVADYWHGYTLGFGTYLAARSDLFGRAILLFTLAWLAFITLRKLCERRLGGITGDCLGAGIESMELLFLLCAVLLVR